MPFPIAEFRVGQPIRIRLTNARGASFEAALEVTDLDFKWAEDANGDEGVDLKIFGLIIIEEKHDAS